MGKFFLTKTLILLKKSSKTFHVKNCKGISSTLLETEIIFSRNSQKTYILTNKEKNPSLSLLYQNGIRQLFPLSTKDEILGFIGIGERFDKKSFSDEEKNLLETILNTAVAPIEKSISFETINSINKKLDGKIQELKTLFELSKEFNRSLNKEQTLKFFLLTLMGQVGVTTYALIFNDEIRTSRIAKETIQPFQKILLENITKPIFVNELKRKKNLLLLYEKFQQLEIEALIPLQTQNITQGVLCLGKRITKKEYTESDLEFIYSLGNLAITSLENTRLFREAVEKQKMENELLVAREIQQQLLPTTFPSIPHFDIAGINIPTHHVGGDYYDVIKNSDETYTIAIADVAGKGTPASLLMANIQATVRALSPLSSSLAETTTQINSIISNNTGLERFITFFWGKLEPKTKCFRYVNAGHNQPFVFRANGKIERLIEGGIILGIIKEPQPYQQGEIFLQKDDVIVFFSDGISEAMNTYDEDYTEERLEKFLQSGILHLSAQDILTKIQKEIEEYTKGTLQSDDITLVVLKCV